MTHEIRYTLLTRTFDAFRFDVMRWRIVIEMAKWQVWLPQQNEGRKRKGESQKSVPSQIYIIKSYVERVRVRWCANEFSCKHWVNERIVGIMTSLRAKQIPFEHHRSLDETLTLTAILFPVTFSWHSPRKKNKVKLLVTKLTKKVVSINRVAFRLLSGTLQPIEPHTSNYWSTF